MKEIGSEFWCSEQSDGSVHWWDQCSVDHRFYASGRTALDAILMDIKMEHREQLTAYLPSYCCDSMIQPFIRHGILVSFYTVDLGEDGLVMNFDRTNQHQIVFLMEYFGFVDERVRELIHLERMRNKIIIQDVTHSLLQTQPYCEESSYLFGSFRKWTGIPGAGIAAKLKGRFQVEEPKRVLHEFVERRVRASRQKEEYMNSSNQNKSYLQEYAEAEELLDEDYEGYTADPTSLLKVTQLDTTYLREKRRENGAILLKELSKVANIRLPYCQIDSDSAPLFIPIICEETVRNQLRAYLIKNQIYCPIHWPLSSLHNGISNHTIYQSELSLIIDQRYTKEDILYEANMIRKFMERGDN